MLRPRASAGGTIAVCNTHMLVEAGRDRELGVALRSASFAICDGQPIAWLLSLLTGKWVARITGPDLFEAILNEGIATTRVALVGGNEEVLAATRNSVDERNRCNLLLINPGWVVEGDGPSEEIVEKLRGFAPDIVFVGLGCPKQEKWMSQAVGRVPAYYIGVGAAFDYRVGRIRRAPKALQSSGGEWLYRAMQQPRLARRYLSTMLPFLSILVSGLSLRAATAGRDVLGSRRSGR